MITTRQGVEAHRGGLDLTISLTADQADALGADAHRLVDYLDTVMVQMAAFRTRRDPVLPEVRTIAAVPSRQVVSEITAKDRPVYQGAQWDERVLQEVSALLTLLDGVRDATLRTHAGHGGSISRAGYAMGVSKATAQTRRNALQAPSPAELRVVGAYGGAHHPGSSLPAVMRPWSVAWPGYTPVDVNPPELLSRGLAGSDTEGRPEAMQTPDNLPPAEWLRRSAAALVPFDLDDRGWPLNPAGRTGRVGRNLRLRHWGENAAADCVVRSDDGYLLMIRRDDLRQWAFPGGMMEPAEDQMEALRRVLLEQTGLAVSGRGPEILRREYLDDGRATDHAWVCSVLGLFGVPKRVTVVDGDDAVETGWFRADSAEQIAAELDVRGGLYEAHRPLLQLVIDRRSAAS